MRRNLTAADVANTARMLRTQHKGAVLIVEGSTDMRVYGRFVAEHQCKLVDGTGKDKAVEAIALLEKTATKGVLAIVDSDFWRLDGFSPKSMNVLLTDTHDLETMLVASRALDKLLAEFGRRDRLGALRKPVREALLESALPIGYLRWLSSSSRNNLRLKFKGLSFAAFVDPRTLNVDQHLLLAAVLRNSTGSNPSVQSIKAQVASLKSSAYDPWQVCSGHDLIEVLTIGLRSVFGNFRARRIKTEVVEGAIRLAYEITHFADTSLYGCIRDWENANQGFIVLA